MTFDINDCTTWTWKPIDTTGMKNGDYLPNPHDRLSFYQLAAAGNEGLLPPERLA